MPDLQHEVVEYWTTDKIRISHLVAAGGHPRDGYYTVERIHFIDDEGMWRIMFNPETDDDAHFETLDEALAFLMTVED